jgi:hypothetical protein
MKTIYLSGPISRRSEKEYPLHFYKAADDIYRRAALENLEINIFNPVHYCKETVRDGAPWHEYMRRCVSLLAGCDGIALLQGWENSRGARLELNLADALKIPVVYIEPPFDIDGPDRFPGEVVRYFEARYARCIQKGYNEHFSEDLALHETANRYLDPHGFEYLDGPEPEITKEEYDGAI